MYISNSTMEKLVEKLRKKMNGPTEAISRIRDVLVSDVCHIPEGPAKEPVNRLPLSSPSSSEDEEGMEDDNDDDDDSHDEKLDASKSDKDSSIASDSKVSLLIDSSSVNLSGPVTDL